MLDVDKSKIKQAMLKSDHRSLQEKLGEWSLISASISGTILSLTGLFVAILWSIQTITRHPALVISAWSGGILVLSLMVFGTLLWIDRHTEEEEDTEDAQ